MNIVTTIVEALTEMLTGSTQAITEGVQALFVVTGTDGEQSLSTLGVIIFTLLGLGFAVGLVYVIINLVRR